MEVWTCLLQSENKIKLTFEKKNRKYKKNIFPGDKKLFTTKKIMILGIYLEETSHISYQQLTQQLTELNLLGSPRLMT